MDAKKILIVDDEEAMRVALAGLFQLDGYSVVVCASGEEALARWTNNTDITHVVSDYSMPCMNGLVLAEKLKAKKNDLVIVINTATEWVLTKRERIIKELGLKDILDKSARFDELKSALGLPE